MSDLCEYCGVSTRYVAHEPEQCRDRLKAQRDTLNDEADAAIATMQDAAKIAKEIGAERDALRQRVAVLKAALRGYGADHDRRLVVSGHCLCNYCQESRRALATASQEATK